MKTIRKSEKNSTGVGIVLVSPERLNFISGADVAPRVESWETPKKFLLTCATDATPRRAQPSPREFSFGVEGFDARCSSRVISPSIVARENPRLAIHQRRRSSLLPTRTLTSLIKFDVSSWPLCKRFRRIFILATSIYRAICEPRLFRSTILDENCI